MYSLIAAAIAAGAGGLSAQGQVTLSGGYMTLGNDLRYGAGIGTTPDMRGTSRYLSQQNDGINPASITFSSTAALQDPLNIERESGPETLPVGFVVATSQQTLTASTSPQQISLTTAFSSTLANLGRQSINESSTYVYNLQNFSVATPQPFRLIATADYGNFAPGFSFPAAVILRSGSASAFEKPEPAIIDWQLSMNTTEVTAGVLQPGNYFITLTFTQIVTQ
ncbi:MAG: hypothetical protein MUE97_05080, partial [Phycisphaerales bacterium]|nr:hypothetical protein [Phycisphaerales bacterium]